MTAYTGQTQMALGQLCTTLWDSQGVCSDASSTEMQCLGPLHHSGALSVVGFGGLTLDMQVREGYVIYVCWSCGLQK